ncbi:MAG: PQQ-binding-like beta-propeller repeat protein [Syntrophobacteraceae bacterium]
MRRLLKATILAVAIIFALLSPHVADASDQWPMYQANPAHTGYVPVSLDPNKFILRWQKNLGSSALNPVAAGGGRVFATKSGGGTLDALDSGSGDNIWSQNFDKGFHASASYSDGKVYIQNPYDYSNYTLAYLHAYDAATGNDVFASEFDDQGYNYNAPTVYKGKVYIQGGEYGGMYSFDGTTGMQDWFYGLPQFWLWTPAVDESLAYAYVGNYDIIGDASAGVFAVDRVTGQLAFQIHDPNFQVFYGPSLTPVLGGLSDLFVINNGRLIRFDLNARAMSWVNSGKFSGQPSVANGVVYAINAGALGAYDQKTGTSQWAWAPPSGETLQDNIIVTNAYVFVGSQSNTYCIDPVTCQVAWSYPSSGYLSLGEGALYVAGLDGTLSAIGLGLPVIYVFESVTFDRTDLGRTLPQTIPVSNLGDDSLEVQSIVCTGGEFGVQNPPLPFDIGPHQSVAIEVSFTPTPTGTKTGNLLITSNDPNKPQISVALSGKSNAIHTISAAAGVGGHITPSGSISVIDGGLLSLNITPDMGYGISNVVVDGVSAGTPNFYVFNFVTGDHSITAAFSPVPYQAINVPGDYPSIQAAIAAAADGDWVLVAPGTYEECIDFLGKGITVTGSSGPEAPVIDAKGKGTPVTFDNCGQKQSVLQGFVLTNGAGFYGNGVAVLSPCSPLITDNIFLSAYAGSNYPDIAINVSGSASPVIERNAFFNSGGIHLQGDYNGSPIITNNLILDSSNDAIEFSDYIEGAPEITNNTIVGSHRNGIWFYGGVIGSGAPLIKNNIIVGNGNGINIGYDTLPDEDLQNNLAYGNTVNYSGVPDKTGINGNISADPVFLDPINNDYHLYFGSPAIGAGDASSIYLSASDLDGKPRDINGKLDIGAYETDQNRHFALHTITASAGAGGTMSPQGENKDLEGTTKIYLMTPNVNYQLAALFVDGVNVSGPSTATVAYAFNNINSDHTITAVFNRHFDYFGMDAGNHFESEDTRYGHVIQDISLDTYSFAQPSYMDAQNHPNGMNLRMNWYQVFDNGLVVDEMTGLGYWFTFDSALPYIQTPLAAGKRWTGSSTLRLDGEATIKATVHPMALVSAPAGHFMAWPIAYDLTASTSGKSYKSSWTDWFTPYLGWVLREWASPAETSRLKEFKVGAGTITTPPPVITGISPASSVRGSELTINGFQFGASQGASLVIIGNVLCDKILSWSNTQIRCTVPQIVAFGPEAVTVVTDTWTSNDSVEFTVLNPPQVASLNPSSGKRGSSVQITGINFGTATGKVFLGKVQVKVTQWTDTSITFTVPSTIPHGTYSVTVADSQGQSVLPGAFTVVK